MTIGVLDYTEQGIMTLKESKNRYKDIVSDIIELIKKGENKTNFPPSIKLETLVNIVYEDLIQSGKSIHVLPPSNLTYIAISYFLEGKGLTLAGYRKYVYNFIDSKLRYVGVLDDIIANTGTKETNENLHKSVQKLDYYHKVVEQYYRDKNVGGS